MSRPTQGEEELDYPESSQRVEGKVRTLVLEERLALDPHTPVVVGLVDLHVQIRLRLHPYRGVTSFAGGPLGA